MVKNNAKAQSAVDASVWAGKTMPESLASEAGVLGSMLIDPECIGEVIEQLSAEDFYRTEHRYIFEAIISLYEHNMGVGIDGVLLRDELEKAKRLEAVGGLDYLAKVIESVPSSASVMYYVKIVKDKALLRELISTSTKILSDAYEQSGDPAVKLDEAEQKMFAVTNRKITGEAESLKDLVTQAYTQIEKREGKHVTGLATEYHELDQMTSGLQKGELIIIAGRPSMGKTSFMLNIAENIGILEKKPLAIFSLEMGRQQLAERFLCSHSRIESQLVRKGMLSTEHYEKLVQSCSELSETGIYIDDTASLTPLELRAKARRLKSRYDIQCVMVDYLQLMSLGAGRIESRQQEITTISRYIKALARELYIPVIVLSQLNRSPESREDHRPRMSDLRESGSIEQDADVVMLLHREDYYHRGGEEDYTEDNSADVIIAKQRNGPTGTVKLRFLQKFTRFENAAFGTDELD